jgi:adenine-specific DNA-methyltransferase
VVGIAALLNTKLLDNYFRSLNGNTQVNATDIRNMPFPDRITISKLGEIVHLSNISNIGIDLDYLAASVLNINKNNVKSLYEGEVINEKN